MPLETTWADVFTAALGVEMPTPRQGLHRVTTRTISMHEKVALILDRLQDQSGIEFSRLLKGFGDTMHGGMTLLAGLELTRRRVLFLRQSQPFSELWFYRREEDEDGVSADLEVVEVDS